VRTWQFCHVLYFLGYIFTNKGQANVDEAVDFAQDLADLVTQVTIS